MRCLDLFCKAGGTSMGYFRSGYDDVTGVDIEPQPHYPFRFILGDALEYVRLHGHEYDLIHASPPCQAYSRTRSIWNRTYPELLPQVRKELAMTGRTWVIENVVGAPFYWWFELCGSMFGLRVYRHRRFECSQLIMVPVHPTHVAKCTPVGRQPKGEEFMTIAGHFANVKKAGEYMGIDWMNQKELAQAIPPTYTEYIGRQLLSA